MVLVLGAGRFPVRFRDELRGGFFVSYKNGSSSGGSIEYKIVAIMTLMSRKLIFKSNISVAINTHGE